MNSLTFKSTAMIKRYSLLLVLFFLVSMVKAQVNYAFSATTGTFNSIAATGTNPTLVSPDAAYTASDEGFANGVPIGFNFIYNGSTYTSVNINANGYLSLGAGFILDPNENYYYDTLSGGPLSLTSARPLIAPFWADMDLQAVTNLTYSVSGTAPNRIFTVEWANLLWDYTSTAASISFQAKLYETTNVIDFIYKQESGTPNPDKAGIGITAAGTGVGNFLSLSDASAAPTASSTIEAKIYTRPATGQIYRFTPRVCDPPTNLVLTNVTGTSATITWTAFVGATGYEYTVTNSNTPPSGSGTATTATTANLTGLVAGVNYVYVRTNCGGGFFSQWAVKAIVPCTTNVSPANGATNVSIPPNVSWNAVPGATGYTIMFSTDGGITYSNIGSVNSSTTSTTIPGTVSSTTYYWYIRAEGGNDTASQSCSTNAFSFTTEVGGCVAVSAFTQNFDAATVPALPTCWNRVGLGGIGVRTQTTNPASSPNTVYIYSSTTTSLAVMSMRPVTGASTNTNWLRFDARGNFTAGANIEVGYLTNPTDSSTFVSLQTVNIGTLTYQNYTVTPGPITGSDITLAFRHTGAPAFSVLIDNVTWEAAPSCVPPTALGHSSITTTGAQMDWTAPTSGTPASYDLYYSTSNVTPTSTTTPSTSGITSTTATLTGLTPSTQYFVWVRSNCGAGGLSTWSVPDSFYTQCGATNVPYLQNFELATVPNMPPCTSSENVGTGNNWATVSNPGNGFTSQNLGYGYNAANAADAWFYTQGLNLTAGTSYRLTFKYGNNSATFIESMNVSYGTSASAVGMANLIVDYPSITAITVTPATSVTDFTPATTGVYYIGFHVYSIADQFNLYVDDISVELTPSCSEPTALVHSGITTTGAQMDWTAPTSGTPASYDLYYSTSNVPPTSTTTPSTSGITSTTATLTGLTPSTQYFVWVRSNCGASGYSTWSSVPDSFYTQCGVTNVPYLQDFELATLPNMPPCTSSENVGTGNNWVTVSNPGNGFTSQNLRYGYNTTNAADAWFYTQGLNLTGGTSYRLTFKYGNNSATFVESMNVNYGTSASAVSMTNPIVDYPTITALNVTPAISATDFTPTTTGVYYIGFHVYSVADQFNLFVDDISVDVTPAPPTNDPCTGAINLPNGVPVPGTTIGATESLPANLCNGFTGDANDDVWYSITAINNGDVNINLLPNGTFDAVLEAFTGSCTGTLTSIGCADDSLNAQSENLLLTGLNAGQVVYIRVFNFDPIGAEGTFVITATGSAILPVKLVSFKGERAGLRNNLYWATASEQNNRGFELQRSADGENFSALTFVPSKAINGNSSTVLSYQFYDEKPFSGNNYYRLKQVDTDGKITYSFVVLVKGVRSNSISMSAVYPNPTNANLKVVLSAPASNSVRLVITDVAGKVVMQQASGIILGDNLINVNVAHLPSGTYMIKTVCKNGCETTVSKFVKQ